MMEKELRKLRKTCRHKAEVPAMVTAVIITLLMMVLVIWYGMVVKETPDRMKDYADFLGCQVETVEFLLGFKQYIAIAFLAFLMGKFGWTIYRDKGKAMTWETPVSDRQFPEVKEICREYADRLGVKSIPMISIASAGTLKMDKVTFSNLDILRIHPSVLSAGIKGDDTMIRYEAARAIASDFLGYRSYLMLILMSATAWIPFFQNLAGRISCYSIDRVIQYLMGDEKAAEAVIKDSVSYYLYKVIDYDAYYEDITQVTTRASAFAIFLENLQAEKPIPAYRIAAIKDPEKKDGKLF